VISPTSTTIDNDIASHGIAGTHLVRHRRNQRTLRAKLTVHFQPFQLYEFAVMRNAQRWANSRGLSAACSRGALNA
jgi:hypothetical protein